MTKLLNLQCTVHTIRKPDPRFIIMSTSYEYNGSKPTFNFQLTVRGQLEIESRGFRQKLH
jgi:hypothetical protein